MQVLEGAKIVDRTGAVGKLRSVYVRDPDGNLIEYVIQRRSKLPANPQIEFQTMFNVFYVQEYAILRETSSIHSITE